MNKKFWTLLSLLFYCEVFSMQLEELTYDHLIQNPYSDHVQHFEKLFKHTKIHSFLEFGLGYGTKYLLDHSDKVTSYEILLLGQSTEWFDRCKELFHIYPHWHPHLKYTGEAMQLANFQASLERRDPALHDGSYLLEFKNICDAIFEGESFEAVLVDPGFHMRGDLVNELFDHVPIIAAHDTNGGMLEYGWNKIQTPSNYEKIHFSEGMGVTFWIRHDQHGLISALKNDPHFKAPLKKKLRVFFPHHHPALTKSMAQALQHLGHTLVLPGKSFDPASPQPGLKISYGIFPEKYSLPNIEVIENDTIFCHPPDVLFVNCFEVENSIYHLYDLLKEIGADVKLAHFSGNNETHFSKDRVKNLIAVDAYTAPLYDCHTIFWIPWIDFEHLALTGTSDAPILNNYISHYNSIFRNGFTIFTDVSAQIHQHLPQVIINSPAYLPQEAIFRLMDQSCATLHIKESEGFGYTIIESLAKGRPVFLKRSFSLGSRLMNWCIEGKTAFFFDEPEECVQKLNIYLSNPSYRQYMQEACAETIRRLIDNEKQARILDKFLQEL